MEKGTDEGDRDGSDVAASQGMPTGTRSWRRQGTDCPWRLKSDHDPAKNLVLASEPDFGILTSRNFREYISVV